MLGTYRILPVLLLLTLPACNTIHSLKGEPDLDVRYLLPPDVVIALDQPTAPPQTGLLPIAQTSTSPPQSPTFVPPPQIQTELSECRNAYSYDGASADAAIYQVHRDNCIMALMAMIDMQYDKFRDGLLKLVDDSDLLADIAILGLGSATTLVPGKTTKSILGAISAGIAGSKAAVNSDVLYNSSIILVINQMDADRSNQRCTIITEMKNAIPSTITSTTSSTPRTLTLTTSTTVNSANLTPAPAATSTLKGVNPAPPQTYSMYDASADLVQYYIDGTFTHALQTLEAKTGSQATASKQQATNVKTGTSNTSTPNNTSNNNGGKGAGGNTTTNPTMSACSS